MAQWDEFRAPEHVQHIWRVMAFGSKVRYIGAPTEWEVALQEIKARQSSGNNRPAPTANASAAGAGQAPSPRASWRLKWSVVISGKGSGPSRLKLLSPSYDVNHIDRIFSVILCGS
jgi:hypothetical protein